jgi:hypothetical protein
MVAARTFGFRSQRCFRCLPWNLLSDDDVIAAVCRSAPVSRAGCSSYLSASSNNKESSPLRRTGDFRDPADRQQGSAT